MIEKQRSRISQLRIQAYNSSEGSQVKSNVLEPFIK